MKYPVGTICRVASTSEFYKHWSGRTVTVTGHSPSPGWTWNACDCCGSQNHLVLTDAEGYFGNFIAGCCLCVLVPIDDPDAGVSVEEAEELSA